MTYGPADLYVIEFPTSSVPSTVTATLRDVAAAGVITLMDVALVRTDDDGAPVVVELDEFADEFGMTGLMPLATGIIGIEDIEGIVDDLTPGTSTLVVLMENTWARNVARAVLEADARVVTVERFPAEVVNDVAALATEGQED
ncbi:MAG TPA: DUF6325 family protein [Propionicimonas sp.]